MHRAASVPKWLQQALSRIATARHSALAGTDAEGVHELRVALRGLRAILPLLGGDRELTALRSRWHALAQETGPCRDLEVMLAGLEQLGRTAPDIQLQLVAAEEKARRQLCTILATPALPLLLQDSREILCRAWHKTPEQKIVQRAQRRARRLRQEIRRQIPLLGKETAAREWHALRLKIKHLRYQIELGGRWLPRCWQKWIPVLKNGQAALGELHDLDMLLARTGLEAKTRHAELQKTAQLAVEQLSMALVRGHRKSHSEKHAG